MRRLWVKLLVVSVVVALAVGWWWVSRPGTPSRLTAYLPANGVNAAVFIDDPADLAVVLEARFGADDSATFFSKDVLKTLTFDPRDTDAWALTGLDEEAGVAVILFENTGRAPIVLARIDDEGEFVDWLLEALSDGATGAIEGDGEVRTVTLANTRLLMGRRGPYTAIMRGGESRSADFRAFLAAEGRLITDGPLRTMFRAAATRPRVVAFAQTEKLAQIAGAEPGRVTELLKSKAPVVSGFLDDVQGAVSISLTESGRQALRAVTRVHGRPPAFSRLMPAEGWSALRVSLDLGRVFEQDPDQRSQLRDQMQQWAGSAYVDAVERVYARIGARLSGHIVVAMSNASLSDLLANPGQPEVDWAVFAGIAPDEERPLLDGLEAPARYVNGIAVFASSPGVLELIKPGEGDSAAAVAHGLLDADVLFGLTLTTKKLLGAVEGALSPGVYDLFKTSRLAQQPHLSIGFSLEADGVVSRGDSSALVATAGLAALVVYPDLVRRRRARWQREARTFVARIAQGAIADWQRRVPNDTDGRAAPPSFPQSAGPTPSGPQTCGPMPVDARQWDAPGWRALNFAVYDAHRYRYAFEAGPNGFTARAIGDLDCDEVTSTFEAIGRVVGPADAGEVILSTREVRAHE